MALEEYAGAIVLEIDGQEVEVVDIDVTGTTGRRLVKTMNRTGKAKGFAKGIAEYSISITAVVPLEGDIDWAAIEGAKLVIYPVEDSGKRMAYRDCFSTEVGVKYSVDNEARRDIKLQALNYGEE